MATTNIVGIGDLELVSDDLQDAREADVGIDGVGNAVFVWARYDPADDLILARTLRANGSLEAGRTLSVLGASAEGPEVAVNEVGDAAFAWTRWDGMRDRVQGLVDLASSLPGSSQWLSAAGQAASDARAVIDGAGNAMFAWERWDGSDWRIQSARLPAGGVLDPVETHSAAGESASDPQLAIETGGTAALAWSRWDGAIHRVQVRRLPAGGIAGAVSTRSAAGAEAGAPAAAIRPGGWILLAWQGFDSNDNRIEYSVGSPLTPPIDAEAAPLDGVATPLDGVATVLTVARRGRFTRPRRRAPILLSASLKYADLVVDAAKRPRRDRARRAVPWALSRRLAPATATSSFHPGAHESLMHSALA